MSIRKNVEERKIRMDRQDIKFIVKMLYLGITLDRKLNFRAHVNYLSTKISKPLTGLSLASRPSGGLNMEILRILYRDVVEPILLYCICAFQDILTKKKWAQRTLSQIQRGFALGISKAYCTVSIDAALILAGIELLYMTWHLYD